MKAHRADRVQLRLFDSNRCLANCCIEKDREGNMLCFMEKETAHDINQCGEYDDCQVIHIGKIGTEIDIVKSCRSPGIIDNRGYSMLK